MVKLRISLLQEFTLYISLVIIFTSFLLTYFFITREIVLIRASLKEHCHWLARDLARSSEQSIKILDHKSLTALVGNTLSEEDAVFSAVYDHKGNLLAAAEKAGNGGKHIAEYLPRLGTRNSSSVTLLDNNIYDAILPVTQQQAEKNRLKASAETGRIPTFVSNRKKLIPGVTGNPCFFWIPAFADMTNLLMQFCKSGDLSTEISPVTIESVGFARVCISSERLQKQINAFKKGALLVTVIVIMAGILLSVFFVSIIRRPLRELLIGTQRIAQGHLDCRVNVESLDEIGELARSFNSMAEYLMNTVFESDTERAKLKQVKTELEERTKQLEEILVKMKNVQQELLRSEKFAMMGRLASSVAHELRNPLASVKNISYYLLRLDVSRDEKVKRMLEMLSNDVTRANKIVTDLMDYSRVKRLNKCDTKINEFIDNVLVTIPLENSITIIKEIEVIEANIDPDRMTQVIINLLTNARDAMPNGGTITISAHKSGALLHLGIKDTGIGMKSDMANRIFEPLFTTKTKGLGLGLAIVKEIIDAHFGRISVATEIDKGTTFTITIPL
jgi:signal transduction histidine kinase